MLPCPKPRPARDVRQISRQRPIRSMGICLIQGIHCLLFRRDVRGRQPAIHRELGPRYVARLIRGQVERRLSHLRGLAEAAHGYVDEPPLALFLRVQEIHQQIKKML